MKLARVRFFVVAVLTMSGCGSLLGVDGYEPVDCVERCEPVAASPDGAVPDSGPVGNDSSVGDARDGATQATGPSTDASACTDLLPCDEGYRIAVRFVGAGDARLSSDPGGISVVPGETASACFARGRLRLDISGGTADFAGARCEDGSPTSECEIDVSAPACVTVTLR